MQGLSLRKYKDNRRFSFPHTFGTAPELVDIDLDTSLSNPNQNLPNPVTGDPALPNGCTAFARADIATNEDRIIYKPGFTYEKACFMENVPVGSPLPLETTFKAAIVYGLQAVGETTDAQALAHRRGPYFEVHPVAGQDMFDSLWSALIVGRRCISVGTLWYPELTAAAIVDSIQIRPTLDGHDWEAVGVQTVNGQPYMKIKWWGGAPKLFSRMTVNALCATAGSDALTDTDGKATGTDIQTVKLTILQTLVSYYYRWLKLVIGSTSTNIPSMNPDSFMYAWDTPKHNYHNVRVLCDKAGLSLTEKNLLCSVVYQESEFYNYYPSGKPVENLNLNKDGSLSSTDWGLLEINDFFHIGVGKDFPSVDFVLKNPEKVVLWFIGMYRHGNLYQWSSYKLGLNRQWLSPSSPMWKLAT